MAAFAVAALLGFAVPAWAQAPERQPGPPPPEEEWGSPAALELVSRARAARRSVVVDSALRSYRSEARGFVYFFLDRNDSDERTLVKTDQVALDVFWRAPGETRQRIVGLRDEKSLPTNIRYHLDHLTVVQDEFGDRIRLGDGDEVESVLHPVGLGAEVVYDYRLADSLTLEFGSGREPVRVYQLEVRPRDIDRPGFVGSIYLDRATASIVRMNFTFTPSSYVDPYLDYIRISLDNGLWLGRYWLPYRQEAELRRELPQLDFLAGSVIRGRFEIGGYVFNEDLPDRRFAGRTVLAVPEAERLEFPFEDDIFAGLAGEGLDPSSSMQELTEQVRQIVQARSLTGLRPARLYWSSVSEAVRYNRAEGLYLGAGASTRIPLGLGMRAHGGWSLGRDDLSARAEWTRSSRDAPTRLVVDWRMPRDIGPIPASSGLFNSLASLAGEDWRDLYFASGVQIQHRVGSAVGTHAEAALSWEDHRAAALRVDDAGGVFRPVLPIEAGVVRGWAISLVVPSAPGGLKATGRISGSRLNGRSWLGAEIHAEVARRSEWAPIDYSLRIRAGGTEGAAPPQAYVLLGGRGTLPGHPHRTLVGNRYWLADARVGRSLRTPWIGIHATAAVGQAFIDGPDVLPTGWVGLPSAGVRGSLGLGVDALWDVVTIDVARGLGPGGEWTLLVGVNPRFHPWL
ncbi:MAG: hypothetical protein KJP18_11525 [Gemmatimonadetes bacterium]|nr:hypothetical protein [Gemmatimonadota bacterium]